MADSNNGRTDTLRPEDSGPARPSRGNLPPKLVAATEAAQGVLAGWFLAAGGRQVVVGLMLLAFMAVTIFAPPRLQRRLNLAVMVAMSMIVTLDLVARNT